MLRPAPRRSAGAVTRAATRSLGAHGVVGLLAILGVGAVVAAEARAQPLATHTLTSIFDTLPDTAAQWTRIGGAGAIVVDGEEGQELLINDNSPGDCIAFQALLGEIESAHRVTVSARMRVLNNLGGHSVMIEVSRPGLEMILQLDVDRIDVFERRAGRESVWLAGVDAPLAEYRELRATKLGRAEDPRETLVVELDGVEVLRVAGRGDGMLGVGRVVFGSLDYPALGASVWRWIAVSAVPITIDGGLSTEESSLGELKARYLR